MKPLLFVGVLLFCGSAAAESARWTIDYAASRIGFTAEQAEEVVSGRKQELVNLAGD